MAIFERYSATEIFGVPLDNPTHQIRAGGNGLVRLMTQYDVSPQPLPEGMTDITPYYGTGSSYKYFLSYSEPEGLATVDLMPTSNNSITQEIVDAQLAETQSRAIRIPTDQDMFALVGRGPRFGNTLCIHELITYRPQ